MPAIIVAAAGAAAGSAIAGAVGLTVGSIAYGVVSGLAAAVVGSALSSALGLNKAPKQAAFTAAAQDRQQMIRSAVATRHVVYGQAMMSGPIVFAASTGSTNEYLHLCIPLAHGECESIESVQFGDDTVGTLDGSGNVTSGRFSGLMRIKKHLGSSSQTADSDLVAEVAEWTTDHRLQGITYLYIRLKFDAAVYPYGLENIKALTRGRKVYDPRTTTTVWSDNWALCIADYLQADFGLRATAAEVNVATHLVTQANICDESVSIPGGGTQARYTCNGSIDTGNTIVANLRSMLSAAVGNLVYTQGEYRIYAAAYSTPTIALTENDLRGDLSLQARPSRQSLFNGVRGTFVSPDNYWQPSDFPQVVSSTYETQDGGEQLLKDIELPFTTDSFAAQRMAKIVLERGRQGITAMLPCKLTAFKLAAWDVFSLTIAQLGWSSKAFRVTRWILQPTGGIDLELQEEASTSYAWSSSDAVVVDAAPDTTLPSLLNLPPPTSLAAASGATHQLAQPDGLTLCRLYATWTAAADSRVVSYELQHKITTDTAYQSAVVPAAVVTAYIAPVQSGVSYHVRVRSLTAGGVPSAWAGPVTIAASSDASTVSASVDYADVTGTKPPANADNTAGAINTGTTVTSGGITFSAGGAIKGGQTDYNTGTGWFLGYSGGAYKFSIGDSSSNYLRWTGSSLELNATISAGGLTFSSGGAISSSGKSYGGATAGVFLGYSGDAYKFDVGNSTNYIRWDGSSLTVGGSIIATGNIVSDAISKIASSYAEGSASFAYGDTIVSASSHASTSGNPQVVIDICVMPTANNVESLKLYRDATAIATFDFTATFPVVPFAFTVADSPGDTSAHTYALKQNYSGASRSFTNRSIVVATHKR